MATSYEQQNTLKHLADAKAERYPEAQKVTENNALEIQETTTVIAREEEGQAVEISY